MGFVVLFPIAEESALLVVLRFVIMDKHRIQLVGVYVVLILFMSLFVMWQIRLNHNTNTTTRKVFHVLIVLVYIPGLWYQCTILYMGSTFILALLVLLEVCYFYKTTYNVCYIINVLADSANDKALSDLHSIG